jgi:endonuclease/exonuclease/phosphatase family metal-dependent hydrolase
VLGDINAGPEASPDNYKYLLERGFDDTIVAPDDMAASKTYVTWDNQNALNKRGPHANCPPQRCDHIFLNRGSQLVVQERRRVLTEPVVPISESEMVTISDHYGLLVKLAGGQGQ